MLLLKCYNNIKRNLKTIKWKYIQNKIKNEKLKNYGMGENKYRIKNENKMKNYGMGENQINKANIFLDNKERKRKWGDPVKIWVDLLHSKVN